VYAADGPIHTEFGLPTQNEIPISTSRPKSKQEEEFQYGDRSFPKSEVVLAQPWIEISLRNLVHLEILTF